MSNLRLRRVRRRKCRVRAARVSNEGSESVDWGIGEVQAARVSNEGSESVDRGSGEIQAARVSTEGSESVDWGSGQVQAARVSSESEGSESVECGGRKDKNVCVVCLRLGFEVLNAF